MTRSRLNFTLFLLGLCAIYTMLHLLPDGLVIMTYVGDTIHAIDLALRLQAGDAPGRDFVTPLGVLSFLPASFFLDLGFGPGRAFLLGQVLVLAVLVPAIFWVGLSRLSGWVRYGFALCIAGLTCALVYGGTDPTSSIFMYYNRWGWALAFLIATQVMLPARDGFDRPVVDGVFLGAMMGALVGIKVTFFLGVGPFVLLALLIDRKFVTLAAAAGAGLLTLAAITAAAGYPEYLLNYARDLLHVAGSDIRPRPSLELTETLTRPAFLPGTVLLAAIIIFWRNSGAQREGLLAIVLAAGMVYITYQNWGNDPKWALLFAMFAYLIVPTDDEAGPSRRLTGRLIACGLLVFAAPSAGNILYSPFRIISTGHGNLAPLFPEKLGRDVLVVSGILGEPVGAKTLDEATTVRGDADETENAMTDGGRSFHGIEFPACILLRGSVTEIRRIVSDLEAIPDLAGAEVLLADFNQYLWMFGDFARLKNGVQPWYNGGDVSQVGARYLAVPVCPIRLHGRNEMLKVIENSDLEVSLIGQTASVTVFRLE